MYCVTTLHTMCFLLGCVLDPFQIDLESVLLLNKLNALHQKKNCECIFLYLANSSHII